MRKPNWPELLAEFIDSRRRDPFSLPGRDCVALCADWVEVCTGERKFTGTHTTTEEANAAIAAMATDLPAAVTCVLGPAREFVLEAQRGDLMSYESEFGPAIGICIGSEIAIQGVQGLMSLPMEAANVAWEVGRG